MDPSQVPSALRRKVEAHILSKLKIAYPHVLPNVASAEASAIETTAFAKAKSRSEYICIVTSYSEIHHNRDKNSNDSYRIPRLSAAEERTRIGRFHQLLDGEGERIQRDTQSTVNEQLQKSRGKEQQRVQNDTPQSKQLKEQPSIQSSGQANVQGNWVMQQNLQSQIPISVSHQQIPQQVAQQQILNPVAQQQILQQAAQPQILEPVTQQPMLRPVAQMPQLVTNQQIPQMQANMVYPQTVNQAVILPTAQNHGINIIKGANGQPQNMQTGIALSAASPGGFRYIFPDFPFGNPQGVQEVNPAANAQQSYIPVNFVDPRQLVHPQVNATVIPTQSPVSQGVSPSQTLQNQLPTSSQQMVQPVTSKAQNRLAQSALNSQSLAEQFPDEMITQLAHQTALAAQSAPAVPMQGNSLPLQRERRIAPNAAGPSQTIQNPQMSFDRKSQLVAKWINLQRAYRPRIERIKKVLDTIIQKPTAAETKILEELEAVKPVLRVTVERLMGDQYSEINYMKAAAHLSNIVEKYKQYENMDWAEVRAQAVHVARVRGGGKGKRSPSNESKVPNSPKQTALVQECPLQITNLQGTSQYHVSPQVTHPAVTQNAKTTIRDAQNQVSDRALSELREQKLRAARSRAAQEIARKHHMRTAAMKRATSLPAGSTQGRRGNVRKTNSTHHGAAGQASKAPRATNRSLTSAEATRQAALAFRAGNAALAAANAHCNPRKRTAAEMGMTNQSHAPVQKKASTIQDTGSVGNLVTDVHPSVQNKAGPSHGKETRDSTVAKQTIQPQGTGNSTTNPAVSQRIQEIVQEHVRSNVTQHVHKHIQDALSVPSSISIGNPNEAVSGARASSGSRVQQERREEPKPIQSARMTEQPQMAGQQRTVQKEDRANLAEPFSPSEPLRNEVEPSETDILKNATMSPANLVASIECSRQNLTRILAEDPVIRQVLNDFLLVDEDEDGIERIQRALDGEKLPVRSQQVEETLKALEGSTKRPKTPEPKTPPKPKTQPKSKGTKKLTLIEQVREDYEAFEKNCDFMRFELHQEYKKPVLLCKAMVEEILIPNLVLRIFKGYPNAGTVTYSFQEPVLGWCGPLSQMRSIFQNSAALSAEECGVHQLLEAWKEAIMEVTQKTSN